MSNIPFECVKELVSSAFSTLPSSHSLCQYTSEPTSSQSRTWRSAGFYFCISNDRRLVLEGLEDSNITPTIVRIYFENPLEIIFARKVESDLAELAALVTEATQEFRETIEFLGSAGSDITDSIPALHLSAEQSTILEDALKPVPPPCDVSRIPSSGVEIETTPVPEVHQEPACSKKLLDEMRITFPEIIGRAQDEEEESPWMVMADLVDWLDSKGKDGFDTTLVQRLVEFAQWCELQPRGETPSDDIYSILVVGLYENLFLHQHTKTLIPRLMSKADLESNKQYLVSWVGKDNYDKALDLF